MTSKTLMCYQGKRLVGKVLKHCCTDGETSWHYPKAKDYLFYGAVIGREYEAKDEKHRLPEDWSKAETGVVHPMAQEWQLQQRLDIEKKKGMGKPISPELDELLDQIDTLLENCNKNQRTAFLVFLIERMTKWRF